MPGSLANLVGYVGVILLVEISYELWLHQHLHITPLEKFYGIALIIGLSLIFAASPVVQRICHPLFHVALKPVEWYDKVASAIIALLLWPFKSIVGCFRKSPAGETPVE